MVEDEAGSVIGPLIGTRVLKANVDAVVDSLDEARAAMTVTGDVRDFATVVATAALTALDHEKTRYMVGTRRASDGWTRCYGPFATYRAAEKAATTITSPGPDEELAGIWPLIPSPTTQAKRSAKRKRKQ